MPFVANTVRAAHNPDMTASLVNRPEPLPLKYNSLYHQFEDCCRIFSDRPILGTRGAEGYHWITYGEFASLVQRMQGGMATLGLQRYDKVAIIADNSVEWAVTCYAAFGCGAIIVPMYTSQKREEWEFIVRDSGAKILAYYGDAIADAVRQVKANVPTLHSIINLTGKAEEPDSYRYLVNYGEQHPVNPVYSTLDDLFGLVYTSGTTGVPKGVMLSHRNMLANIEVICLTFDFNAKDVSLAFLPWAHMLGQGSELHLLIRHGFATGFTESAKTIARDLSDVRPTLFFTVPKVLNKVHDSVVDKMATSNPLIRFLYSRGMKYAPMRIHHKKLSLIQRLVLALADRIIFGRIRALFGGRLRIIICGGASLERRVTQFIQNLGIGIYEGYGLTESSPIIAANCPKACRIGSVGRAIPGVIVKIDHSCGDIDGKDGEIIAYGDVLTRGYYNLPEETAAVMTEDGGFRTGDLGRLDKDGYLYITGRLKEQYKLENGRYIVPSAIEDKLKLSRHVDNVLVYGDGRPQNIAIITLNRDAIGVYAKENGLTDNFASLVASDEIKTLVSKAIHRTNKYLKSYERVVNFVIVPDEWTPDSGLLTQSLKIKRSKICQKYQKEIDDLYDPQTRTVRDNPLLRIETARKKTEV